MGLLIGVGNTKPKFPYDYYYGIEWDSNVANSTCKRLGRPELHVSLPIQNRMRRCVLRDNGTVAYYLHANDSTKRDNGAAANLDGTDGQVMVEIPAHYRKFEIEGTKFRCFLSEFELPGFHLVPLAYRSAYEASLDRTTPSKPKLASVVNTSPAFRGGNNAAGWDGTYRSLLGMPTTGINLTNFRAYARNRGNTGLNGAGWNCDVYNIQKNCYWLYIVEYANFYNKLTYNAEPTSEGYKQGGLGPGVTTLSSQPWKVFNDNNPIIPCGYTNSLGNHTGVVNYTMPPEYGTLTVQIPSYRGIENPFGHIWKWVDGCKCLIQADEDGGLSKFYVCDNPANFTSSGIDNYELRGNLARKEGFVKELVLGEFGEVVPLKVGASSTTYICNYFFVTTPKNGIAERGLLFGGNASNWTYTGLIYTNFGGGITYSNRDIGSRLCFLPENR